MKEARRRFTQSEYSERQHKTRQAMQTAGLDLLIVYDPANMNWLTGYDAWSFYTHQCVVIGSDDTLFWYGRGIDRVGAGLTTDLPDTDIIAYPDHYVQSPDIHPMEYLADILKQKQLHTKQIGIEKDNYYFSARAAESLYNTLPDATFSDATALVNWQRAVKSSQELSYMRTAGSIIGKVYEHILDVVTPDMRKNELAAEISHAAITGTPDAYGDYTSIVPLIGLREEAATSHMTWDNEVLGHDSGMFIEIAAAHARYHCPCSRTLYLGTPTPQYRDVEKVINECIEVSLEKFKPGVTCGEVASTFFNTLKKHGYEKENRCGYPIGLSYPPDWGERTMSLRTSDTTVLEENMTLHFMPALWLEGWGFETTESIVVTESGGECLSHVPRELLVKD
ncbi:M24 family metallopeptidase [Leucothrix pacifica]|uniref:Ectoine hydrolase DoeA n=1 Tax=Leucothrix pacifica TaxID=1247513 RepID=A0A317CJQ9_9GAMM|nr:M24 family metallopeptidase [Leucothrix pacifica]PWQ97673.1 ectoine hydrolase DoeA [Leucothrix pacifica]